MPAFRPILRSLGALAVAALVAAPAAGDARALRPADERQAPSPQQLLERGQHDQLLATVDAHRRDGAEHLDHAYLAAQALIKMEQGARAAEEYGRLRTSGNPSWALIGESGQKLLDGDVNGAVDAAQRAVETEPENPFTHYQLGLAFSRQGNFEGAARHFDHTIERAPTFAYAHYYAGLAYQRVRQLGLAAERLENFLKLAPEAPERIAVISIMRSLRG